MPLLQNTFDPARFNSTVLAIAMYEVQAAATMRQNYPEVVLPSWPDMNDETLQREYIDQAQQVLDRLVAAGVFSYPAPVAESDMVPVPDSGPQ